MLFTVDAQRITIPPAILLSKLDTGYGVKTEKFPLDRSNMNWIFDLPQESETGLEVVPGQVELDLCLKLFEKLIHFVNIKEARLLAYKKFSWKGHLYIGQPMYVKYTVHRVKPLIQCTDVDWLAETLHADDTPSFSMIIKQRIYP